MGLVECSRVFLPVGAARGSSERFPRLPWSRSHPELAAQRVGSHSVLVVLSDTATHPTAIACLLPTRARPNLIIRGGCLVNKCCHRWHARPRSKWRVRRRPRVIHAE